MVLAWVNLQEVFVMLVVVVVVIFLTGSFSFIFDLHFIVVLHPFLFMWCCSSFIAFQRHPSPFHELSPGFYTHFILSAQSIAEWFTTSFILTFLGAFFHSFIASDTVLSGYFLPTGVFYLMLLHRHFPCVYQSLPSSLGAGSYYL